MLGLNEAAGGHEVFAQLVLTRIIEPTSKAGASQAALGPASPVLYDVPTLHFEADAGDRVP
ncbi:hypothetical protein M2272_003364 [Mycobacterium frederiksbergense]|uniref:Uncharacterized protein n=1 Tax=Mycolicibacterium frederiksbergense TaxID=117567 RepID=A0ABT6L284_9MYCO|nr:hypothetical protein [Mycolicibacterium frederiksbergense]